MNNKFAFKCLTVGAMIAALALASPVLRGGARWRPWCGGGGGGGHGGGGMHGGWEVEIYCFRMGGGGTVQAAWVSQAAASACGGGRGWFRR